MLHKLIVIKCHCYFYNIVIKTVRKMCFERGNEVRVSHCSRQGISQCRPSHREGVATTAFVVVSRDSQQTLVDGSRVDVYSVNSDERYSEAR